MKTGNSTPNVENGHNGAHATYGAPQNGERSSPSPSPGSIPHGSSVGPKDTHFTIGLSSETNDLGCMIQHLEDTLKLQLVVSPVVCQQTAQTYEELGMLCHKSCDFTKAIRYYHQARIAHESLARQSAQPLNKDKALHGETIVIPPALDSPVSSSSGQRAVNYTHITSSGDRQEGHHSYGSYDVARCLSYLGVCYRDAGKLETSKKYLEASLHMKYATVGQYHESTAETLNNLGALYHATSEFSKAAECYEDAVRILIGTLGGQATTSPYVAFLYYNLGVSLIAQQELGAAIIALTKALRVAKSSTAVEPGMDERIEQELQRIKQATTAPVPRESSAPRAT